MHATEARSYKVGDTVYLNSGGPPMKITAIDNGQVDTEWHDNAGELQRHSWPIPCVTREGGPPVTAYDLAQATLLIVTSLAVKLTGRKPHAPVFKDGKPTGKFLYCEDDPVDWSHAPADNAVIAAASDRSE